MRPFPLPLLIDAATDAGDWKTLAAAAAADDRAMNWPPVIIADLFRIATEGVTRASDVAKVKTCLARLEL